MKLYDLAKRIANFVWDLDPYHARDCYTTFGEAVSETWMGLSDKARRVSIAQYLLECEIETEEAHRLAKEVLSLG